MLLINAKKVILFRKYPKRHISILVGIIPQMKFMKIDNK